MLTSHRMWLKSVTTDQHALICAIIKQRAASDMIETPSMGVALKLQAKFKGIGPYTLRTLVFGSSELEAVALHEQQACTWLQKQTQCTHTRMTRCNKAGFSRTPTPSRSAATTLHMASLLKSPLVFLSHFLLFLRSKVILQEHTLHMKHIIPNCSQA